MKDNKRYQLEELNEIMDSMSQLFSTVSRQIVIALCGLIWLQLWSLKNDEKNIAYPILVIGILLVIVYFAVELLQYFISFTVTRNNWFGLLKNELTEHGSQASMSRLNKLTYRMACTKFILLIGVFIIVFIYFGGKLLN